MKVLFINSVCGIRSTGRIVTDLVEIYKSIGYECRIAYGRSYVPEQYKDISYRLGNELEVRINALKVRVFDNEGFNARRATERFIKWANNYNPDILWIHNLHGYYINIDILFKWIKSRPEMEVKWTLHDCWAFTGHCSHFSFVKCEQWKNKCEECMQKREYPKSIFRDNSYNNYVRKKELFTGVNKMTLIVPSNWLAELLKESFLKDYTVEVKHNSIDTVIFKPTLGDFRRRYGLEDKTIILGVASTWTDRKGLTDFIKLSKMIDDSYAIVLVGLTKKQIANMPSKIIGIEKTDSKRELAEIYSTADVFLNLTYEDTYPTVNLEAQACGTTCITYRTGGSVESVSKEYVVNQGDLYTLVLKISKIKETKK